MENEILEDIKKYAIQKLMSKYTYCGCAEGDDFAMLNSDDKNGNDFSIVIKSEPDA